MSSTNSAPNQEQTKLWNGPSGTAWVDAQAVLDQMFRPFEELLVEAAASAARVLDVGCGTGSTTIAIARKQGATGRSVGIDLSEPMIAVARTRAETEASRAAFIVADAQTYAFEPGSFDMIVSRFGVMFFDDPTCAFANLRRAASEGGELFVIAWRSPADNPFMTAAEQAAAPLLPNMPPRKPDAPGQFAFADSRRVQSILDESGWAKIEIRPLDVTCSLPEKDLNLYLNRLGPVGRALQDADEHTRRQVTRIARGALDRYVDGADVRFTAACWMVSARADRR